VSARGRRGSPAAGDENGPRPGGLSGGAPPDIKGAVAQYKKLVILEQACALFYSQGYDGTTLDAVAERLRVTKPFIYTYYKNKARILQDISERGIRLSLEAFDAALTAPGTPTDRLRRMVEGVTRVIIENQAYIVVYQREEKNLEPAVARQIRRMRHGFDRKLETLLDEGIARREFAVQNLGYTAVAISGVVSWVANWYVPGGRLAASEVVVLTMQMVMRMVGCAAPQVLPPDEHP
jgi:AcrR family transcriptional regulator